MIEISKKDLRHVMDCTGHELKLSKGEPDSVYYPDGTIQWYRQNDVFINVPCKICKRVKKKLNAKTKSI